MISQLEFECSSDEAGRVGSTPFERKDPSSPNVIDGMLKGYGLEKHEY